MARLELCLEANVHEVLFYLLYKLIQLFLKQARFTIQFANIPAYVRRKIMHWFDWLGVVKLINDIEQCSGRDDEHI